MWREVSDYNDHCYRMSYSSYNFTSPGVLIVLDVTTHPPLKIPLLNYRIMFFSLQKKIPPPPLQNKKTKWKGGGIFWPIFSRSFLSVSNHSLFFGKVFILEKKNTHPFPQYKNSGFLYWFYSFLQNGKIKHHACQNGKLLFQTLHIYF